MEDAVHSIEQRFELRFDEVDLTKREAWSAARAGGVRFLQAPRVIVGERVDADHVVASFEKIVREVGADKAGASGDEIAAHVASRGASGMCPTRSR